MDEDPHANDPLPPGWSRGYSKSQKRNFYFHSDTKHTQWHFPTVSEAKDPLKAKKRAEMNKERQEERVEKRPRLQDNNNDILDLADSTCVALVVPYRDIHAAQQRSKHLQQFIPHMVQFLSSLVQRGSLSNFHIYIVEQSNDNRKFNRGKLLNIGFDLARKSGRKHDVFVFHDVDLLPQADLGPWYAKFPSRPIHIARVWNRYANNPKYFGGVVSFSSADYRRINGYPNTFWGWGGEDDEMHKRLEQLGMTFESPNKGTLVDLEDMSLSDKLDFLRQNREWKCMVKWEALEEHEKTWKTNGMADLQYKVLETTSLDDKNKSSKITVDVQLNGDHWSNEKAAMDYMGG